MPQKLEELYDEDTLRSIAEKVEKDDSTNLEEKEIIENLFRFIDSDYDPVRRRYTEIEGGEKLGFCISSVLREMRGSGVKHLTENMFSNDEEYAKRIENMNLDYMVDFETDKLESDDSIKNHRVTIDVVEADRCIDGFNGSNYLGAEHFI